MHQCINELSNSLRHTEIIEQLQSTQPSTSPTTDNPLQTERKKSVDSDNEPLKNSASHFVTVIEVKEMLRTDETVPAIAAEEEKMSSKQEEISEGELTEKFVSAPLAAVLEAKKKIPPR